MHMANHTSLSKNQTIITAVPHQHTKPMVWGYDFLVLVEKYIADDDGSLLIIKSIFTCTHAHSFQHIAHTSHVKQQQTLNIYVNYGNLSLRMPFLVKILKIFKNFNFL